MRTCVPRERQDGREHAMELEGGRESERDTVATGGAEWPLSITQGSYVHCIAVAWRLPTPRKELPLGWAVVMASFSAVSCVRWVAAGDSWDLYDYPVSADPMRLCKGLQNKWRRKATLRMEF